MYFVVAYAYSGLSPVRACPWRANSKKDTYNIISVFNSIIKISFQKIFIQKELLYSHICDPIFILPRFKVIPYYNDLAKRIRYSF